MNNKTRAEEHLLPPSKGEDKGERSRRDPVFDLLISPYSFKMEPKLMVKILITTTSKLLEKGGIKYRERHQRCCLVLQPSCTAAGL